MRAFVLLCFLHQLLGCQAPVVSVPMTPQTAVHSTFQVNVGIVSGGLVMPVLTGTGWVAENDGVSHVVTAGHVCPTPESFHFPVAPVLSYTLSDMNGTEYAAVLERKDTEADLCMIRGVVELGPVMELAEVDLHYGDYVSYVGAPDGVYGCTPLGCGVAPIEYGTYIGGRMVSIPTTHGASGSAIFTQWGVVGVLVSVDARYEHLVGMEPEDNLRRFLGHDGHP